MIITRYFLVCVCLAFFSVPAVASLKTELHVQQNHDYLHIEARLQESFPADENQKAHRSQPSDEKIYLKLGKKAEELKLHHAHLLQENENHYLIQLSKNKIVKINYKIKVDLTKINYFLDSDLWYPQTAYITEPQSFSVQSKTTENYHIIHSAVGLSLNGISMVFGRFVKYQGPSKQINIYLQNPDSDLAEKLIDHLEDYLKLYQEKIGPYPYSDFSVVEAADDMGFAFPQMTWIGSKLLRFPFILTTSLPHELLHSWWGNSVFVDYSSGNWCEGLTTYGADYGLLSPEAQKNYRRKILTEYADYVKNGSEISLAEFVSRGEDRALQAIGYGKSAMMFIMLEKLVGPSIFQTAIKSFYKNFKLKKASYLDLFNEIKFHSEVEDSILDHFYEQWIIQKGAADLQNIKAIKEKSKNQVHIQLPSQDVQRLKGMTLDLVFKNPDGQKQIQTVAIEKNMTISLDFEPFSYSVDPDLQIFRLLTEKERPLNFSRFFGSGKAQIVTNLETFKVARKVFSNSASPIEFELIPRSSDILWNQKGIVLIENYQPGQIEIDLALEKAGLQISKDAISINKNKTIFDPIKSEIISLENNSYFLTLAVGEKTVVLFQLNQSLPTQRWFERWLRYGAQSFIVLSATSAVRQEIFEPIFERPLMPFN